MVWLRFCPALKILRNFQERITGVDSAFLRFGNLFLEEFVLQDNQRRFCPQLEVFDWMFPLKASLYLSITSIPDTQRQLHPGSGHASLEECINLCVTAAR